MKHVKRVVFLNVLVQLVPISNLNDGLGLQLGARELARDPRRELAESFREARSVIDELERVTDGK